MSMLGYVLSFHHCLGLMRISLKAFSGIEELVADVVADMISNNEKVPTPLSGKYSRQFVVLVLSGSTKLALEAAERGVDIMFSISKRAM